MKKIIGGILLLPMALGMIVPAIAMALLPVIVAVRYPVQAAKCLFGKIPY